MAGGVFQDSKGFQAEKLFEERITKRRHEKGEGINTGRMQKDQVNRIIIAITTTTSTSEAQLKDHSTGLFHQVKNLLSTLTNPVLVMVPHDSVTQREA